MGRPLSLWLTLAFVSGAAVWLGAAEPVRALEWASYDLRLSNLPSRRLDERIVLVAVDSESNQAFGRWPWGRDLHARLIEHLLGAGASVVALDIAFSGATEHDGELARALRGSEGSVVMARTFELDSRGEYAPDDIPQRLWEAAGGDRGVGSPLLRLESDGKVRRLGLARLEPDLRSFGVLVLEKYTGQAFAAHLPGLTGAARLGEQSLVVDGPQNRIWLDFPSEFGPLLSYASVLEGRVDPKVFRGKIVLVGSSSDFNDFKRLPDGRRVPGFLVHATLLDNVLGGWFLRSVPVSESLLGVLLSACTGVALLVLPFRRAALTGLALSGLYAAAACWLMVSLRLYLPMAVPILMVGAFVALDAVQHGRRMRSVLSRFMPGRDIEAMVHRPERLEGASETREATVLFADLRDFTSLSERRNPEQVRQVVDAFHQTLGEVFARHGGYVCDFQGDAQMVVFGLDKADDHARSALLATLELVKALDATAFGVGICTGEVSVGYLRGGRHLQYTALGDTTNTAARLQGKTRELGKTVILSHTTVEAAGPFPGLVPLQPVRLKGKNRPHPIFTLER